MNIVKIIGNFVVEQTGQYGYVTEDGTVYITFKGDPVSKSEFKKRVLALLGFTNPAKKEKMYSDLYDEITEKYAPLVVKEVAEEPVIDESDRVIDKVEVSDQKQTSRASRRGKTTVKSNTKK